MHSHHRDDFPTREGPPPWAGPMTGDWRRRGRGRGAAFGPGGPFFGQGPRASRGDIRAAVLALLAEQPMHGYQIIQEITDRSAGVWTPSPGSVYPTLQHLEDEGLVTVDTTEGKKVFTITDTGRATYEARGTSSAPWENTGRDVGEGVFDLRDAMAQVVGAVRQVARGGNAAQLAAATRVLAEARRSLYRILAEDDA